MVNFVGKHELHSSLLPLKQLTGIIFFYFIFPQLHSVKSKKGTHHKTAKRGKMSLRKKKLSNEKSSSPCVSCWVGNSECCDKTTTKRHHHFNRCTMTAFSRFASFSVWLSSVSSLLGKVVMRTNSTAAMAGRALTTNWRISETLRGTKRAIMDLTVDPTIIQSTDLC